MKNTILYILFLLFSISITAQNDTLVVKYDKSIVQLKKFDTKQLKKYRNNSDFDYTVEKQETGILKRIWHWFKRLFSKLLSWLFGVEKAVGIMIWIFKIVPYLILLIILILLIKFFLKVDMNTIISGKTEKATIILTEDEEIIKNKDISKLIEKAIAQKKYRLAVRYYYLLTLQKLQENELIEWEPQKTNEDYSNEIKEEKLCLKFKKLTHLYDFVWYGNFEINEFEFEKAATNFNDFKTVIKTF